MELTPKQVLLDFQPDTLSAVRQIHGLNKPEDIEDAVDKLEKIIKYQKHLAKKDFSRCYLENTIICSKGSVNRAQNKIENVCRLRSQLPQYFGNYCLRDDFKEFDGIITHAILPKLTKDFNRILFIRNTGKHFQSNLMLQMIRIFIMIFEYLKIHDYSDGIIVVVDLTESSLVEVMKRINLIELKQAASILIEGYGVRVKGIHVLSKSRIINVLVWVLKQVLNAKLIGRVHVHKNTKPLYNFIAKDILPVEYGGKEKSLTEIHESWVNELSSEEFRNYLTEMTEARLNDDVY